MKANRRFAVIIGVLAITLVISLFYNVVQLLCQNPGRTPKPKEVRRMRTKLLGLLILMTLLIANPVFALGILDSPVDCTFENVGFPAVIAELAKQAEVDILVDPKIEAKVTVNLGQTYLGTALNYLCGTAGVFYQQIGPNSIVIASADPKGPYFYLVAETEIVPVNHVTTKEVMILLSQQPLVNYMVADETSHRISITAPPVLIERAKAEIAKIDKPKKLIQLTAIIMDTSGIRFTDLGSEWERTVNFPRETQTESGVRSFSFADTIVGYRSTVGGNFLFLLYNYYSKDKLEIRAKPTVVSLEGEEIVLYSGQDTYVPISTGIAGTPPLEVKPVQAGTRLKMTARVVGEDEILVKLDTEASEVVGTGVIGLVAGMPIISRRSVQGTMRVYSGETIFIGGLANSFDYTRSTKVPILGDIPLLGNLFRGSVKQHTYQEITILLTPRIVTEDIREGLSTPEYISEQSKEE